MYGFILLHLQNTIVRDYGEDKWIKMCKYCGFEEQGFSSAQRYPDQYILKIADAAVEVLNVGTNDFFESVGSSFIRFLHESGHGTVVSILGRSFSDFIKSLNYLHEYIGANFLGLTAPSFTVEKECKKGLILHYHSQRRRLIFYLIGILKTVAFELYEKVLEVDLMREEVGIEGLKAELRLNFANDEFTIRSWGFDKDRRHLPVSLATLLHIFPFAIVLNRNMQVEYIGESLIQLVPRAVMANFGDVFQLLPEEKSFSFKKVTERTNCVYTVTLKDDEMKVQDEKFRLKGQMKYAKTWDMVIYLGTPVIPTLDCLLEIRLFLNDLPMHDFSRDNVLTATQESTELRLTLETEQEKTMKIRESIRQLDEAMDRTNRLLYQMIPKHVAEQLKGGQSFVNTCKMYASASVLLSDVVRFTEMCSEMKPMDVVTLLNRMYSMFDGLTEKHGVYKLETIGDAYMVVAGLDKETDHASRLCDMALDMIDYMVTLKNPVTGNHITIRVGIGTGPVVAGVVGQKMPRYCLFGQTKQLAAVMENTSQPMRILVCQLTADCLPSSYVVSFKGFVIHQKFMGMRTYWLVGKTETPDEPSSTDWLF